MNQDDESVDEDGPTQVFARPARLTSPRSSHGRPDGSALWDVNDVAHYLKVSKSWVYHRAESGLLPCVRIGSLLRFDPKVIARLAQGAI